MVRGVFSPYMICCFVLILVAFGLILVVFALFWGIHCRFLSDFGCFCPVFGGMPCFFVLYIGPLGMWLDKRW